MTEFGWYEQKAVGLSPDAHLSDDRAVAKMGHPALKVVRGRRGLSDGAGDEGFGFGLDLG